MKQKDKEFFIQNVLLKLDKKKYVLTGDSALNYCGISVTGNFLPDLMTENEIAGGFRIAGRCNYHYVPNIDYENYVTPLPEVPLILIPTRERAIAENIKYDLAFIDEGYFCDALERYQHSSLFNYELLLEVAEHFGVPKEKIDYWLEESSDFNSY